MSNLYISAIVLNKHFFPIILSAQDPLAAVDKVEAVVLSVEGHHITAKHPHKYFVNLMLRV
jgi:hypothetical protein